MWQWLKRDCLCLAGAISQGASSPSSQDTNCSYICLDKEGRRVHDSTTQCVNQTCLVCGLFSRLDVLGMVEPGLSKNMHLNLLLLLSEHLSFHQNSADMCEFCSTCATPT